MLCNSCNKREAAVIVQMSVNGQLMSRNLCPACAQQMHIEIAKSLARAGTVLDTLKKRENKDHPKPVPQVPEAICSSCGHAIRALTGNSRMGCARCYDAFRERIAAVIAPDKQPVQPEPSENDQRREIHRQLEQALVHENYELAAVLRDRLRSAREGDAGV